MSPGKGPFKFSCPKLPWDISYVPGTDGRGDRSDFANAVSLYSEFNFMLPDTNSEKIHASLRVIFLESQLYDRARELCVGIHGT